MELVFILSNDLESSSAEKCKKFHAQMLKLGRIKKKKAKDIVK